MVAALRRPASKAARADADGGTATLQASLERRILRGLAAEWENALWLLPDSLRRSIRRPLFDVRDMHRRLGCWDGGKREIALSRELVGGHRWDDIREVLLHEMAHQVAHEGMQAANETDHGKSFQQACRLLRANPAASGNYRPLHVRLQEGEALSTMDRIVAKIQKLMALAESSNPHEANAAMRKAYHLIAQYNVDRISRGVEREYHSIFLGPPRLRHFREAYHLAHLLQDFYFVQGMWVQAWVLEKEKMGRVLEISGTRKNVLIAEYIHGSVCRYIDTTWEDYRRGKGLNRYRKSDFALGVIEGFKATLQQASASGEAGSRLPARIEDQALTGYLARRYPHVRSFSRNDPGHDVRVLADGTASGRKLVIAKGITRDDGFKGRALAPPGDE
jgi:hypothetical protein